MKRILLATVAAVAIAVTGASSAYAAPAQNHFQPGRSHVQTQSHQAQQPSWSRGQHLPKGQHWTAVNDYQRHHLRRPPAGQHWVKVGNEYLLVGILSGIISSFLQAN